MRGPIGYRFTDIFCLVLVTLLFGCTILEARAGVPGAATRAQTGSEQKTTLKERMLEIPPGTMIEVRLLDKQKIRGRLGNLTDEGFSLTTAQGDKIATQKVTFEEVRTFKKVGGSKAGHTLLYAMAGIGALFVGLIIWAAAATE